MVSISRARSATALLIGLAAAGVAETTLPASFFRASAIVAVDEPDPALRLASARNAANLAVSKPVVRRAAASLDGTQSSFRPVDLSATAGDGFVEVRATAFDATRASRIATAVAEAVVSEEASIAADTARRREVSAVAILDATRNAAKKARERLATLGLPDTDPEEASSRAATVLRDAESRLAAVHAVIAAGTPPLGAGTDLPANVAALQRTYWDLKRQYDQAIETLGERHTTVIALHNGVDRASANLVAEWQRLARAAANDVSVAKSREAVLRKTADDPNSVRRAAYDAVRGADAAVAQAVAAMSPPPATSFRLMAPAAVPAEAVGLATAQRDGLIAAAGGGTFLLVFLVWPRRRRDEPMPLEMRTEPGDLGFEAESDGVTPSSAPAPELDYDDLHSSAFVGLEGGRETTPPLAFDYGFEEPATLPIEPTPSDWPLEEAFDGGSIDMRPSLEAVSAGTFAVPDGAVPDGAVPDGDVPGGTMAGGWSDDDWSDLASAPEEAPTIDRALRDALRAVAAELPGTARGETAPMVMVAAMVDDDDTSAVALALGEAAADLGLRVLVIEDGGSRPTLAARVAPDGAPILVDLSGTLRVALPADRLDGLFVAPALRDGPRITAALARNRDVDLVDDPGVAFDVVVIDGGRAADGADRSFGADLYLRVGRSASQRDDARFLSLFAAAPSALLGTVAAGRFAPREEVPTPTMFRPSFPQIGRGRESAAARRVPRTTSSGGVQRRRINGR